MSVPWSEVWVGARFTLSDPLEKVSRIVGREMRPAKLADLIENPFPDRLVSVPRWGKRPPSVYVKVSETESFCEDRPDQAIWMGDELLTGRFYVRIGSGHKEFWVLPEEGDE